MYVSFLTTLVIFKVESISEAKNYILIMYNFQSPELNVLKDGGFEMGGMLIFACGLAFLSKSVPKLIEDFHPNLKSAILLSTAFVLSLLLMVSQISEFLYFQF